AHLVCDFDGEGEKERLCHVFAGALLLPRPVLERELFHRRRKITLWELAAIKEKYGISLQAVMHRAFDLDLIGPRHLRDFKETIVKNGWSVTEPAAYKGKEESVRFKRLLHYAVAEKIIGIDQAALFAGTTESKFRKEMGGVM
ncbi:MAG: ImmA/IrrE family metallo-endopeptidase, partial [Candidatus Aminicenantes bacterium]|nr:ImmA/IrrE family metallo-endopeptidase [Candidatus Aminicenantes bacterium]